MLQEILVKHWFEKDVVNTSQLTSTEKTALKKH